ncbi:MAG: hypothetical protein OSB65_15150 [Roseibacillus sp.]|nr:hypothetical protein [Roseibacillus sp.]
MEFRYSKRNTTPHLPLFESVPKHRCRHDLRLHTWVIKVGLLLSDYSSGSESK